MEGIREKFILFEKVFYIIFVNKEEIMSDEELAKKFVEEEKYVARYDLEQTDLDEIVFEAHLAGQRSKEKQLEKMKSLLKEIYEEYGFSELVEIRNNLPAEIQEVIGD